MTQYLQKPVSVARDAVGGVASPSCAFSASYCALVEFLGVSRWPDGTPRVPGTATLFADDGSWKLCLSDKDSQRIAFVTAGSPTEALERAEAGLRAGSLDWRAQRPQGGTRRANRS